MAHKNKSGNAHKKEVYTKDITKNIVESSSTAQTNEEKKARKEHEANRARRRAEHAQKKVAASSGSTAQESKRYDVLAQYHQLNYVAIQATIKELKITPKLMNNTYLVIKDVSYEEFEKIKNALIKCHFETNSGKQYKVRIAGYKCNTILKSSRTPKKPTNNTTEAKASAKNRRKAKNLTNFANRKKHTISRKAKKPGHPSATKDTSNRNKKLTARVKKACAYIAKKENMTTNKSKAKNLAEVRKRNTKAVQGNLKFAA